MNSAAAASSASAATPEAELPGFDRPVDRSQSTPAVRRSGPGSDQLASDRNRLKQLDDQFRRLIQQDVARWDFTVLERDYRQLQSAASLPALASQVDLRLQAIERYRQQQREKQELRRLISETSKRDAELLALQANPRPAPAASPEAAAGPATPGDAPPADVWRPSTRGAVPNDAVPRPFYASQSTTTAPAGPQPGAAPAPRFDGAGIIQRAATTYPGAPGYVLLAPNGRVLSYLEPAAGLNLDPYVGQSVGVLGPRHHRRDLRAVVIIVNGLSPVRLVPAP